MSTKSIVKTGPIVKFFVAEDLRQELSGKVTAIGLYPDNVVIAHLPTDAPDATLDNPIAIASLGFLFNISGLNKKALVSIEMERDGKLTSFMKPQPCGPLEKGRSLNLVGVLQPCLITGFGKKLIHVHVGKDVVSFEFEIRRADLSNQHPLQLSVSGKKVTARTPKARNKSA